MNKPQEAEKRKPTTEPRKKKEQQGPARSNWRTTVEEIEDEPQPRKNQELPFRNVPAVEFASGPPQPKTFNPTRAVPTAPGPKEKSYELKAPIETTRPEALREIMKEVLDSYVRLPFKLLLDSNPELQKETKRMVTKVRVPVGDLVVEQALASEVEGPADELPFIETELSAGSYVQSDAICTRELPFEVCLAAHYHHSTGWISTGRRDYCQRSCCAIFEQLTQWRSPEAGLRLV